MKPTSPSFVPALLIYQKSLISATAGSSTIVSLGVRRMNISDLEAKAASPAALSIGSNVLFWMAITYPALG